MLHTVGVQVPPRIFKRKNEGFGLCISAQTIPPSTLLDSLLMFDLFDGKCPILNTLDPKNRAVYSFPDGLKKNSLEP